MEPAVPHAKSTRSAPTPIATFAWAPSALPAAVAAANSPQTAVT